MITTHVPNNSYNVIHALMIGYNNQRNVFRYAIQILKSVSSAQYISTFYQKEVQIIDTFFMGLVTKCIKTNPLNRMKNHQTKPKTQIVNYG